jgi:RNA polymerase sigma-70 factor (ECF subfamily)
MDVSAAPVPPHPGDDHLLAAHYLPVMRLCLSRLHDPADAEDATQEVFRRAVQHAPRLRDDPLPWLIAVAKNVCTDELRRRRSHLAPLDADGELPAGSGDNTPEGVVVGRMSAVELLGRLTPGERRAVATRMGGGAADAAVNSTTRVLLMRARQKLRQYIEDSQSALGTATVYGGEVMHRARQRMFGRIVFGEGRASLLLPVAVIATVALSPVTVAPATAAPGGDDVISLPQRVAHLTPPRDSSGDAAQRRVSEAMAKAKQPLAVAGAGADMVTLPPPAGPDWQSNLQDHDAGHVLTSDIQPSPTYSSDHTVVMMGVGQNCHFNPCAQIYRSSDGGSSWKYVDSIGAHGDYVVLPRSGFTAGRYYLVDLTGVQRTVDGGRSFTTILPGAGGYPLAAPAGTGFDLIVSSESALWGIRPDGTAQVLSLFPGYEAAGTPLMLPTATGFEVLQPVYSSTAIGPARTAKLLRCAPTCGAPIDLRVSATYVTLAPSPQVGVDHIIVVNSGGGGLAVSHDGGQTFTRAHDPVALELLAVPGPAGLRLVASVGIEGALEFSDDEGMTWHAASLRVAHLGHARDVRVLRPGRLIASMGRLDDYGHYLFVCSQDAVTWSLCSPEGG